MDASDLIESASMWIDQAIAGWLEGDSRRVVALAPLSLEHLGKAALWRSSPTLLTPLDRRHEDSLIGLAQIGDAFVDMTKVRTIGLAEVLSRLTKVKGSPPVAELRIRQIVNCRNGAVHLGAAHVMAARAVLADTLTLVNWLLDDVDRSPENFYGRRHGSVVDLLDTRRNEIEQVITARRHRCRDRYEALVASIPDAGVLAETIRSLSAVARIASESLSLPAYTVTEDCPVCDSEAALVGTLDIDAEVDAEYEDGGITYTGGWVVELQPQTFTCGVCQLRLHGPQELAAADLGESRRLDNEEIDFDVSDYMVGDYADYADYADADESSERDEYY